MRLRLPDLCAWNKERYMVCDVIIVSDMASLDEEHDRKAMKYDTRDIYEWMQKDSPFEDARVKLLSLSEIGDP